VAEVKHEAGDPRSALEPGDEELPDENGDEARDGDLERAVMEESNAGERCREEQELDRYAEKARGREWRECDGLGPGHRRSWDRREEGYQEGHEEGGEKGSLEAGHQALFMRCSS
jgi:flagellar biosynthesis/type III secretory pathway protein FliH